MEAHGDLTDKHPLRVVAGDGGRDAPRLPSLAADYSFGDMGTDFVFFVPSLVAIAGGFDRDIVAEYVKLHPAPVPDHMPADNIRLFARSPDPPTTCRGRAAPAILTAHPEPSSLRGVLLPGQRALA